MYVLCVFYGYMFICFYVFHAILNKKATYLLTYWLAYLLIYLLITYSHGIKCVALNNVQLISSTGPLRTLCKKK